MRPANRSRRRGSPIALHDFGPCAGCGYILTDRYVSIRLRASDQLVYCPDCVDLDGGAYRLDWIPQVGRIDAASGPSFQRFTMQQRQRDGSFKEITLSSVADLRRVERESEVAARNGEGEAVRFRAWSQDRGNDTNTFGEAPDAQVRRELAAAQSEARGRRRQRLDVIRGRAAEENARQLGPGVTEASTGALTVVE